MKNRTKTKHNILYLTGNFLIILSLSFLFFTYYPLVRLFLFPQKLDEKVTKRGFFLEIPKINAQAPIIPNVDPWNEEEYRQKLQHGVAQTKGTALPGESGTIFLFAHSSDVPWRITRYNIAFLRLGELEKNDVIKLYRDGKLYEYKVREKKVVWPNEVQYLRQANKNQLILQTCTPLGTALKRLLVFAKQI